MDWMALKSGTDVRGTAVGEGTTLRNDVAEALGMAFAQWVAAKCQKPVNDIRIAIGRDSRITGPDLLAATARGICRTGASVMDFGMCTTPAMFMCTITSGFEPEGSVMITASHHPWNKNGLKFFTREGGLDGKNVEALLRVAQDLKPEESEIQGSVEKMDFLSVYKNQLKNRIIAGLNTSDPKPLKGLHIVVDAGNGAGGFYADMLESLGACTTGSQFLNPDGYFPNHIPNPENEEAIESIKQAVLNAGSDLGVIFDTDCDRAAVVDSDGREINRNRLIGLISAILLENHPNQYIVTDSVTSSGLKLFIEKLGGIHYRYKRGYRNVIDEAIRLNQEGKECPVAIETSGHAALRENYFLDDGMYLVTVLIVKALQMKKTGMHLGQLIKELKDPVESKEIRMNILEPDFRTKGQEAIQMIMDHAEITPHWHIAPDNREGIRISFDCGDTPDAGWFLLRLSVHDPVLPLNAESDLAGGLNTILKEIYNVLKNIQGLDLEPLINAI